MQHHAIDISALNRPQSAGAQETETALAVQDLDLFYDGDVQALHTIDLDIQKSVSQRLSVPAAVVNPVCCDALTV